MEFTQLHYFHVLARYENFTKAARELYITQPTLSKTIARLEAELGCKLFNRDGSAVHLNEYGSSFLVYVEQIFNHIDDGKLELTELREGMRGSATLVSDCPILLIKPIRNFLHQFPAIYVNQLNGDARQMQIMLEDKIVDFAISTFPILSTRIEWTTVYTDKLGIIVSSRHKMANREAVSLAELKDERFILYNSPSDMDNVPAKYCKEAGFTPNICFSGDQSLLIADLVSQGFGITFTSGERYTALPQLTGFREFDNETVFVPLEKPSYYRKVGIATLRKHKLPIAAKNLYDYVYNDLFEIGRNCPYCTTL